jgi:hypothetical protein
MRKNSFAREMKQVPLQLRSQDWRRSINCPVSFSIGQISGAFATNADDLFDSQSKSLVR